MNKKIHIIAGGTVAHIAPHLAITAPAYGRVGHALEELCNKLAPRLDTHLHLTKMASAGASDIETNEDIAALLDRLTQEPTTKIIFLPAALCDFNPKYIAWDSTTGSTAQLADKANPRIHTREGRNWIVGMAATEKIIARVRAHRKDIFLVGFKTTADATVDQQYIAGLGLVKEASCNLVLANDIKTRVNMVITPEEARYHVTHIRDEALHGLVEMAALRSHLTFTRSTVVAGEAVPWASPLVPTALRAVVDHCITAGAYKPFRGATVGHFACKLDERTFLTSKRKTNFNDLAQIGLVRVATDGPDTVLAYGAKPSVGGQSQRIIFEQHPEYDCVVHFHCPPKDTAQVAEITRSQREVECGSHECGQNTARGLVRFGNLSAVYLDQHGPNIVFHHSIDPAEVIDFIEAHFNLTAKTGGYVDGRSN